MEFNNVGNNPLQYFGALSQELTNTFNMHNGGTVQNNNPSVFGFTQQSNNTTGAPNQNNSNSIFGMPQQQQANPLDLIVGLMASFMFSGPAPEATNPTAGATEQNTQTKPNTETKANPTIKPETNVKLDTDTQKTKEATSATLNINPPMNDNTTAYFATLANQLNGIFTQNTMGNMGL